MDVASQFSMPRTPTPMRHPASEMAANTSSTAARMSKCQSAATSRNKCFTVGRLRAMRRVWQRRFFITIRAVGTSQGVVEDVDDGDVCAWPSAAFR